MMENDGVRERIAELRAKTSAKVEMKCEDLARHLMAVILTPIADLDANSPFIQEIAIDRNGRKRLKMQDKLASARLLCEIMGLKKPEQMVLETGPKTLEGLEARAAALASALDTSGQ